MGRVNPVEHFSTAAVTAMLARPHHSHPSSSFMTFLCCNDQPMLVIVSPVQSSGLLSDARPLAYPIDTCIHQCISGITYPKLWEVPSQKKTFCSRSTLLFRFLVLGRSCFRRLRRLRSPRLWFHAHSRAP